ncbi:MAG: NYN domain-containing protein [Planctomycetes bacterium]|nr:NYN domain-containing protein [Planctomycetota bacterium]MBL7041553.1 NYN domain-containing protein [Pirellulaceae bacterium]
MALIIDGYNLLNAAGIFAPGAGPSTLERSRHALLDFVAGNVDSANATRTTVVFDAKLAPPGLQRTAKHRGLTVRFAAKNQEADDLIEELIRADSAPRQLTVVSSDHRLQRAARKRKAVAIDSDTWFKQIVAAAREREGANGAEPKPQDSPSADEVADWMRRFGDIDIDALEREETGRETRDQDDSGQKSETNSSPGPTPNLKDSEDVSGLDDLADPFPPGYGEDLLREAD